MAAYQDDDALGYDKRYTTQQAFEKSRKDRLPQDHEITDPRIMVIDNGEAEGPLDIKFVMSKISADESLRMIKVFVPEDRKNGRPTQYAVCKIVNKKEEVDKVKASKEKKKKEAAPKTKELELGWAISDHDLSFKVKNMVAFLQKGLKVNVKIGKKRGAKSVPSSREKELTEKLVEEATSAGGRQAKPAEGEMGATYKLYFQGNKPKA